MGKINSLQSINLIWLKQHGHICVGTFNTNHVTTLGQDERRICVGMF